MVDLLSFDPFRELDHFWNEVPFLLPAFKISDVPVDVYETDNEVMIELGIPGPKSENIKVRLEDNLLVIEGRQEEEKEEKGKNYYRKEVKRGNFQKVVRLPVGVKSDEAKAKVDSGMLKVSLPKIEAKGFKEKGKEVKVE